MARRHREILGFAATLSALIGLLLHEPLFGGKVLSPADVLFATRGFADRAGADFEPQNRLLMDPVLQFQPWIELNRTMLRQGRLPLWNPYVGLGAPHLANGQSAVFDPFHLLAYLGTLPDAHAGMAAARLFVAGLGMFLLANAWGLGIWGRWFAGLAFPFCGFLILWLLYPVTSSAVWLPWVLLATHRILVRPGARAVAGLALAVAATLLAGHVQTAAHVLLATAAYAGWELWSRRVEGGTRRRATAWVAGVVVGVGVAAIEVLPLAGYLAESPAWADRTREMGRFWAPGRPRWLDSVCTLLPYAYGSQRRGHPNLARALGVHNLNESAGGFIGLAAWLGLVPLALRRRNKSAVVSFLIVLVSAGMLGAYNVPPVANLLRCLPVLDVMDHRRLSLWVAFGGVLLAGCGLDALARGELSWSWRLRGAWIVVAVVLAGVAVLPTLATAKIRARAENHYARSSQIEPGLSLEIAQGRAERQVRSVLAFVPRYYGLAAVELAVLTGLALVAQRRPGGARVYAGTVAGLSLLELLAFGIGLNPSIARNEDRPVTDLVRYLQREAAPPARVLGIGAELPPNVAMRYGLADVRNYDSVELERNLDGFEALYEPGLARTSRRSITWEGVRRALPQLATAGVAAVVGPTPPPEGLFERVEPVGQVWVGRIRSGTKPPAWVDQGPVRIPVANGSEGWLALAATFTRGWEANSGGDSRRIRPGAHGLMAVEVRPGDREIEVRYEPREVRAAAVVSMVATGCVLLMITVPWSRLGRKRGAGRPAWKNANGSWKAARRRVRIGIVNSEAPAIGSP